MNNIKKFILCFLIVWVCTVPTQAATFHGHHLAKQIDVTCPSAQIYRSFRQCHNMEVILNYLRLLQYAGIPQQDPELLDGPTFRITIHLADGARRIYHLHNDRYLSRDFRPWEQVESSGTLSALLLELPSE